MDPVERNKIIGAVLGSLLVLLSIHALATRLITPAPSGEAAFSAPAAAQVASVAQAAFDITAFAQLFAAASVEDGAKVARKCVSCHTFERGGKNKIGPNLWNVVGAPVAGHEGFGYSSAMAGFGGAWDYERLDGFLASPRKYLRGTNMSFAGLRKAEDRAAIIAYLRSLSDAPAPAP